MLYSFDLTIPASTARTAPTILTVDVAQGTIRNVAVSFPPGCAGLAHVTVLRHEHQVIPANIPGSLALDAQTITWSDEIPIEEVPHRLKLVGWNDDDTYPHTITFRFDIQERRGRGLGAVAQRLFGVKEP